MAKTYDAIVVGSGITGGWAAKELCEAGLETLVLEAGRPVNPDTDSVEHVPVWQMKFRGHRDRKLQLARQPVQRTCYACDEMAHKFFVDDLENPYTTAEGKPFLWIRGRQVGGRSIMWGRQTYRWSDLDFEANAKDGFGADWPIRYADIAPWYDHVERFVGISGQAEGLPQLPDGQFLPPMGMTCAETHVRDAVAKYWGRDRVVTIGRCAVLTQPHNGRAACHYCGPCHRGCVTRSYFSSINATLPAAQATGKLTLRPYSVVHSVIYDPRVPERPRQRQRAGRQKPHGPLHGRRRRRHHPRLRRPHRVRQPSQRHLHAAVPEREGQVSQLPARLRVSRRRWSRRLGARRGRGGLRRRLQAAASGLRPVELQLLRLRRVPAAAGELRGAGYDEERRVGHSGTQDPLHLERQRARPDQRHVGGGGGNALGRGRDGYPALRLRQRARPYHPRDGHRPHGTRPQDVGAQCQQPGVGCPQPVRDRRRVHGVVLVREPLHHLHGADGAGVSLCRGCHEAAGALTMERRDFVAATASAALAATFRIPRP